MKKGDDASQDGHALQGQGQGQEQGEEQGEGQEHRDRCQGQGQGQGFKEGDDWRARRCQDAKMYVQCSLSSRAQTPSPVWDRTGCGEESRSCSW